MTVQKRFRILTVALLALTLLVLGACTGAPAGEPAASDLPTATPTTAPDEPVSSGDATDEPAPADENEEPQDPAEPGADEGEMIIKEAKVLEVNVGIMESWPLQASAQVHGELGDGCTEIHDIETEREGNQFNITITTERPEEAVCTMILRTFDENIPLDIEGLEAGDYVVNANGVETTFTLEQDNVMEPEGDGANAADNLSAQDRTELMRLTLERALVDQEIPDYNLLDDPQNVVLSTENIDAALVPEIEGVTLELLTPEEIQARANEQGDFLHLRFDEISAASADEATVSLSNAWAVAEDSEQGYLSGGGFTVEYTREADGWVGEVTSAWIS